MKYLVDEMLPKRLAFEIRNQHPDSVHVSEVGLSSSEDLAVWSFAKDEGFAIVSKDSDFMNIQLIRGFPPKIVWIRTGNKRTNEIIDLVMTHLERITRSISEINIGNIQIS